MTFIDRNRIRILLLLLLVIFVIFKWDQLVLPFYWDEAWVYGPAVIEMHDHSPGLLPSALPVDLSRGHPLLFHFLAALWSLVFGTSVLSLHCFALSVSIGLLLAVYFFLKNKINENIAFLAVATLLLQPVFLAQSGLVLPEIMLALFCLLALYYYLEKKWLRYFLFGSLAIMTKESGIVVMCAAFVFTLPYDWRDMKQRTRHYLSNLFLSLSPILVFLFFLILQKAANGWYFFPEHINLISRDITEFMNKTERYFSYIFIYQGRNLLFFSALAALIIQLIRSKKIMWPREVFLLTIFIFGFIAFSALNFYSDRYMITAIAVMIVLTFYLLAPLMKHYLILISSLLAITFVEVNCNGKLSNSDHNLGYVNGIKCHLAMTKYCLEKRLQNKHFYAFFMSRTVMSDPHAGYITPEEKFNYLSKDLSNETDYAIVSNFDTDGSDLEWKNRSDFIPEKRFEFENAWIELYKINK